MTLISRLIIYVITVLLYFRMHNDYLLEYFDYLTEVSKLEFSIVGLLFFIIASSLVLLKRSRLDAFQIIYLLLEVIFFAPLITYLSFTNYMPSYFYFSILIALLIYKYNIGAIKLNFRGFLNERYIEVFAIVTVFVSVVFVSRFQFNLDPSAIYDVRAKAADKVSGLLRYFVYWSAHFSGVYLLLRALYHYKLHKTLTLLFFFLFYQFLF